MNIFDRLYNFLMSKIAPTTPEAKTAANADAVMRTGYATSFADPADVRAFQRCKAAGMSDQQAFKYGDNGIGKWGDDTTANRPMCALPPEDWEPLGRQARGARVIVQANGREVVCELRDTMPRKRNIKNGAIIDLNPAACEALGLKPPMRVRAGWLWAKVPNANWR